MSEAIWMVRSGGQVLGPFNKQKIKSLLTRREIAVHDEVGAPKKIWRAIIDHSEFQQLLEEISGEAEFNDNHTDGEGTIEITQTRSVTHNLFASDLTQEIQESDLEDEIVYEKVKEIIDPGVKKRIEAEPVKSYGLNPDLKTATESQKVSRKLWLFVAFLAVGFMGFYIAKVIFINPLNKKQQSGDLRSEAMALLNQGDYQQAMEKFVELRDLQPGLRNIDIYLGSLKIQVEKDTYLAKQVLHMKRETERPAEKKLVFTALGLAHMIDEEMVEARAKFRQALEIDPNFYPAVINLGVSFLLVKNYEQALIYFDRAWAIRRHPVLGLYFALTYIEKWKKSKVPENLEKANAVLRIIKKDFPMFIQEANLYAAYTSFLRNDSEKMSELIFDLLNENPYYTENYIYNLFIDKRLVSWKKSKELCVEMAASGETTAISQSFLALCVLKAGEIEGVKAIVEDAVNRAPTNPIVQALSAFVLGKSGLTVEASVALGTANQLNRQSKYKLPIIMQALFCEKSGDWDCALSNWTSLVTEHGDRVDALTGISTVYYNRGDYENALGYRDRAESVTADYSPLKRLSNELKEQTPIE